MGYQQLTNDLEFIKKTMEAATRYTNIPPSCYLITGCLGLLGVALSYIVLGLTGDTWGTGRQAAEAMTSGQIGWLATIWAGALAMALLVNIVAATLRARRLKVRAWNSLAARMFLSQGPLVLVAGLVTVFLVQQHLYHAVAAAWLVHYGVIVYSFSYFTTRDHRVFGILLILLGAITFFSPGWFALPSLGLGFGVLHLLFGVRRLILDRSPS
jgi:hypothetical protein